MDILRFAKKKDSTKHVATGSIVESEERVGLEEIRNKISRMSGDERVVYFTYTDNVNELMLMCSNISLNPEIQDVMNLMQELATIRVRCLSGSGSRNFMFTRDFSMKLRTPKCLDVDKAFFSNIVDVCIDVHSAPLLLMKCAHDVMTFAIDDMHLQGWGYDSTKRYVFRIVDG